MCNYQLSWFSSLPCVVALEGRTDYSGFVTVVDPISGAALATSSEIQDLSSMSPRVFVVSPTTSTSPALGSGIS